MVNASHEGDLVAITNGYPRWAARSACLSCWVRAHLPGEGLNRRTRAAFRPPAPCCEREQFVRSKAFDVYFIPPRRVRAERQDSVLSFLNKNVRGTRAPSWPRLCMRVVNYT
eukprot:2571430-Prymnesium_polylepis.1